MATDPKSAFPGAALVRKTPLIGFRQAAITLWGEESLEHLGRLMSEDTRRETVELPVIAYPQVPERFVMEWYEAAWKGPCAEDEPTFRTFIDRMMDNGFGRVRRFLLSIVTPRKLLEKSAELWRHDHDTGDLGVSFSERTAVLVLSDHIYATTGLARLATEEIYRYATCLSRTRSVDSSHRLRGPRSVEVTLTWAD